jgi:hypothetical protein
MTRRTRTILFFLFIFIFLTSTPLVILYASGYKINLTWPLKINTAIQKTGALHIDSKPSGATIYINNVVKQKFFNKYFSLDNKGIIKTQAKIKNIVPGEYNVKLNLEGYWPWQKKLKVEPGQTTFAENIILFKNELPLLIKNSSLLGTSLSPNKKYLGLISDKLYILNTENDEIIASFDISSELLSSKQKEKIKWSSDNDFIIFGNKIFNITNPENTFALTQELGNSIFNIHWDTKNNNIIYFQIENSLYKYNLSNEKTENIIKNEIINDYFIKDDNVVYISELNNNQKLKVFSIHNKKIISELELPFSYYYKFLNFENKLVNLYNEKHEILYLIDPFTSINPLREIINNIKYSKWINDDKLFYANNFEIWILDLKSNNKTLITRISESINGIIWHSSNNYIIYGTDKNINIIELDNREKRNITEIINLDNINHINIDKNNNALYFNASIGNQEGLYKMNIQ